MSLPEIDKPKLTKKETQELAEFHVQSIVNSGLNKFETSQYALLSEEFVIAAMEEISRRQLESIIIVKLVGVGFTDDAVPSICKLEWLTVLDISSNNVTDYGIQQIS